MNLKITRIILLLGLALCLAVPSHAQKSKIKRRKKAAKSDSTKVVTPPGKGRGKAAIKNRVVAKDSSKSVIPDSMRAKMIQMANASADSSMTGARDSLAKPRKRFYTRVKEEQLVAAETRSRSLQNRIEIAESRLVGYREDALAGQEGAFTTDQLDDYEASIAQARVKLAEADSNLLAVRTKLDQEGRLGVEKKEISNPTMQEEDDDDEEDIDEPDIPAPNPSGGKGSIKSRQQDPPAKGKDKKKDKDDGPREEDLDNG